MIDHRFTPAESMPLPGEVPASAQSLEDRVHRLEDAVASLQDTRGLEERVSQCVAERMTRTAAAPGQDSRNADRHNRADARDPDRAAPVPAAMPVVGVQPPWLLFDVYHELRAMVGMFCDRRYQVAWSARLIPLAALVTMVLSWWIVAGIWVVGPLLDKAVDVLLAFVAYKALSRETARYRATVAAGR